MPSARPTPPPMQRGGSSWATLEEDRYGVQKLGADWRSGLVALPGHGQFWQSHAGGSVPTDQDRVLAEITGVRVAGRDDGSVFRRPLEGCDGNCGGTTDIGSLMRQDPADHNIGTGDVDERRVTPDSRPGTVTITTGSPSKSFEGRAVARVTSLCSCGAAIITGSSSMTCD